MLLHVARVDQSFNTLPGGLIVLFPGEGVNEVARGEEVLSTNAGQGWSSTAMTC